MGAKRSRAAARVAEVEAWLAEAEASLHGGGSRGGGVPEPPLWPEPCAALCEPAGSGPIHLGLAALRGWRLSLSLGLGSEEWRSYVEEQLEEALRAAPVTEMVAHDVRSFHSEMRAARRASGGSVSLFRQLSALDRLDVALWDVVRRIPGRASPPLLPAAVAEAAASAHMKASPINAVRVRHLLTAVPHIARLWGVRDEWLERGDGEPWRHGACSLLRLLRSRWVEGVFLARGLGGCEAKRAQTTVLRWQLTGRDCAARFQAFAVPCREALTALTRLAVKGGLVELGAHNGHWAACIAKRVAARMRVESHAREGRTHSERRPPPSLVRALDISPPEAPPQQQHLVVEPGTAESLRSLDYDTLLVCMPSPGEEGLCDEALSAFKGQNVVYIGEWGTGMTGTQTFHVELLSGRWELRLRVTLPNWPLLYAELFIFRRKCPAEHQPNAKGATELALVDDQQLVHCASCGGRAARRCPRTRQMHLCSGGRCYTATAEAHAALLAHVFCGMRNVDRPAWDDWEPCRWLREDRASRQEWLRLAMATPHAEVGFGLNWSQPQV